MSQAMVSSVLDTASTITPTAIVFRILALIAIILDVFPLIWHTRAKNLPCASLIAYLMLDNSMSFINSIIWPTDDINSWWSGHGLCDLEIRLMIGTWIGVVACLTCMLRDLAAVLNTNNTVLALDPNQRLKRLLIDCGLCYGFPIYSIIAHYFVQGNRYYILSITGCNAGFDPSWLKVVLVFMWPPALVLVNTYYAGTIIWRIYSYQRNFGIIIASSGSSITKNRFLRLFSMALTMVFAITPVALYVLYLNSITIQVPYSFSRVRGPSTKEIDLVPTYGQVSFDRWVQVVSGYVVFFFFGMGRDAMKEYKKKLVQLGLGKFFPALHEGVDGQAGVMRLGSQATGATDSNV